MDFPPDEDEEAERRSPRECPEDVDENRVTPTAGGESEENHVTPTNTGGEPEETEENHVAPNTGTTSARAQSTDFTVVHPTQVRFTCPVCALTYPKHASLIRHVGVSHKSVNLNIKFKCALCDYTHANKRSTSLHFRHAHGVAIPPATIDGSKEKACPFCPLTFPSSHSCSTHIREKHMTEACQQRSREAAQKEAQQGVSTARTKWTQREIELFKAALAKYGPGSNIKLAKEIGTRSTEQVNVYKCRFLKAYPTWVSEHYHPAIPVDGTARSSATTRSPSSQPQVGHTPPGPSNTQRRRTAGPRALTVPTVNRRRGAPPAFPTSPPSSPPDAAAAGQQLPTRSPTSTTPHQAVASARQHYSPGVGEAQPQTPAATPPPTPPITVSPVTAQPSQEERTPSPPPVPVSEGGVLRLQLLDQALTILRSNNISVWDPEASCFSPPATDLATPTSSSPLTTVPARMHCSPGMGGACQPQPPPATIPPAPAITPPPAPVTVRKPYNTEVGVDHLMSPLAAYPEEAPVSPPSIFQSLLHVPPFVPAVPRTSMMTRRLDQALQSLRGEAPDTSPPPTPPSPPQHASPPTVVSERQHCSPAVDVVISQPLPMSPAVGGTNPPTPPSSPGQLPPPAGVPGPPATITIDPERMDETLRMPMYQELTPFSGRRLGTFEWVAFEEVLKRWSTAIKEVVTAQRRRPPNPTSQWARRRRRRAREREGRPPSPSPDPDLPPDPSQQTGEQEQTQNPTNTRASGRARQAAKARHLQKLYRANPGVCMRRLLVSTPPVFCKIPEPELVQYFTNTFAEPPPLGPPPAWLFPDRHPGDTGVPGDTDEGDILQPPITPEDVVTQFRRTRRTAPGVDGITYTNWRWVDPKGLILSTIFNICRVNSRVPHSWKHSTVILIHKGGDVTSVRNWRPISLQLTMYKLYSAIIARRIASWAIATSAFSDAQKGFLAFDGCAEHNFILRSMMTDSRRRKRNLLLAWLDLRDAFGSVPHHLILNTMQRLGLSGSVLEIVRDIYSHSTVSVRTGRESYTPAIPQNRGVKQGCPLSPILFNIVLESLLKYLATNKAGYTLAQDHYNSLAYADDVCVMASTKEGLQSLLDQCKEFAEWAGLAYNVKKCGSLCLINESHIYVDYLFTPHLGTEIIPALSWEERYRYLGCPTGAYRTHTSVLDELRENLLKDCGIVFTSELAEWQKLDAYRRFLFPRLNFALKVVFPGATWCRKLDTAIRAIIKRGLHLPPRTCTQYLYLSQALGGMGIPSVEDESHVARSAQAFKFLSDSRDVRVRNVAIDQLVATVAKRAPYLDPTDPDHLERWLATTASPLEGKAGDLQSLWSSVRGSLILTGSFIKLTEESATLHTAKHTVTWAKRKLAYQVLKEGTNSRHLTLLQHSADQGRASFSTSLHPDSTFFTYTGAFLSFPQYRFIHRARLNLLPVRTVQARCRRLVPTTQCRTCGRVPETLAHVLNHCHFNLGMARARHNSILERIVRAVPEFVGTKMKEQQIPGTTGDNRPDLTIISPCGTKVTLVEVSCPFEGTPTALEDAANLKMTKYEPLRQQLLQTYAEVTIHPFIVGSLGSWFPGNDRVLSALRIGQKYAALMRRLCVVSAIAGSQNIWYQAMCKSHHRPARGEDGPTDTGRTEVTEGDGPAAVGATVVGGPEAVGGPVTPQGGIALDNASVPLNNASVPATP